MGSVVGEKITRVIERGLEFHPRCHRLRIGRGAMYEGILSLMQMAKTSAALARLSEAGIPYVSILTNPTMAGVMASYATLGDVILAEPKALIGFAGRRVIKETTHADLPEGFQTSEFLLEHGLIDQIVTRHEMRDRLISLIGHLGHSLKGKEPVEPAKRPSRKKPAKSKRLPRKHPLRQASRQAEPKARISFPIRFHREGYLGLPVRSSQPRMSFGMERMERLSLFWVSPRRASCRSFAGPMEKARSVDARRDLSGQWLQGRSFPLLTSYLGERIRINGRSPA